MEIKNEYGKIEVRQRRADGSIEWETDCYDDEVVAGEVESAVLSALATIPASDRWGGARATMHPVFRSFFFKSDLSMAPGSPPGMEDEDAWGRGGRSKYSD